MDEFHICRIHMRRLCVVVHTEIGHNAYTDDDLDASAGRRDVLDTEESPAVSVSKNALCVTLIGGQHSVTCMPASEEFVPYE